MKLKSRNARRQLRVRKSLQPAGFAAARPRLSVYRSTAHIWAQVIDDNNHKTLAAANDLSLKGTKTERAIAVGTAIAKAALALKCTSVVFDRGSFRYHGRVKALAEAARVGGLKF